MNNNLTKLTLITLFSIITAISFLLDNDAISGYQISVYSQINPIIWIFISIAICGGIFIFINNTNNEKHSWSKLGLLVIIIANIIVITLPVIIGYKFSTSGDTLTHLGYTLDILNTGYVDNGNIYPIIHILLSDISIISVIPVQKLINYMGIIYYLLFIIFSFILAFQISKNKKVAMFVALCSTIPFYYFYYAIFPMGYAFINFLIFFYLYFNYYERKSMSMGILLILFSIYCVFFHPVSAFLLVIIILTFEIGKIIFNKYYSMGNKSISEVKKDEIVLAFALIIFISLMLWLWQNFKIWDSFVSGTINLFTVELATKPLTESAAESISILHLSIVNIISLIIKIYGDILILGLLSLYVVIRIFRKHMENLKDLELRNIFIISLIFITVSTITIIDLIHPLSTLSSGRIILLSIIFLPLFAGIALYNFQNKKNLKKSKKIFINVLIFLIISSSSLLAVFSLHASPITYKSNDAVTSANYDGVIWMTTDGIKKYGTITLGIDDIKNYVDANHGRIKIQYPEQISYKIPDHFNYTNRSMFGENLQSNTYMITRENFILSLYTEVYPQINRFDVKDFNLLENDKSVNKIYENGEVQNWYITH